MKYTSRSVPASTMLAVETLYPEWVGVIDGVRHRFTGLSMWFLLSRECLYTLIADRNLNATIITRTRDGGTTVVWSGTAAELRLEPRPWWSVTAAVRGAGGQQLMRVWWYDITTCAQLLEHVAHRAGSDG